MILVLVIYVPAKCPIVRKITAAALHPRHIRGTRGGARGGEGRAGPGEGTGQSQPPGHSSRTTVPIRLSDAVCNSLHSTSRPSYRYSYCCQAAVFVILTDTHDDYYTSINNVAVFKLDDD